MILYFSASGNSKAVAQKLGSLLNEKVIALTEVPPKELEPEGESFGFVFPIYSWGVPPIVTDYVKNLNSRATDKLRRMQIWMVCTCGDDIGMAPEMLKKALGEKNLRLWAGWSVQMPNTYVLLPGFDVDSKEVERRKLNAFVSKICDIASKIKDKEREENYARGSIPKLKSGLIFPLFKRWGIVPSKWHVNDNCVGCAQCALVCPVHNIRMKETAKGERPEWGKDCISCLACYHICPVHAIHYGKITEKKGQYRFPL